MRLLILLLWSISPVLFSQSVGGGTPLEIIRKYEVIAPLKIEMHHEPVKISDDLYSIAITVPPTFLHSGSSDELPADPFAPEPVGSPQKKPLKSAQQILEDAGITFGPGAYALYVPGPSVLKVVSTKGQLDLVEAYCCSGCRHISRNVYIHCEIFELPESLYEQIVSSVKNESNHEPERQALLEAACHGAVKQITSISASGRSGNEITIRAITKSKLPVDVVLSPVLGADNQTLDIQFQFEYSGQKMEGTTAIQSHQAQLIGDWKIEGEIRRIVFLKASVQY